MVDAANIRTLFPFLKDEVTITARRAPQRERTFLDNTASTQIAQPVLEKLLGATLDYANVHRGEYDASQLSTERFERAYNVSANLVNADSWQEITLGRNTTEMINLVMRVLEPEFKDGENIVTTRLEHNSNYVPWFGVQQLLARRGTKVQVRLVDFDKETGELDMDQLERFVDHKTKIVACTGASNFMGVKPDLRLVGEIAHDSGHQRGGGRGSYFLVDGAQLVPGTPVDVQQIGCDFLAWSFHKMSLPFGVGGLYARKGVLDDKVPFLYGGDMIEDVKEGAVKYKDLPWKYTAGTPNILSTIAVAEGLPVLMNLAVGNLPAKHINDAGRQVETQILMNTPRGDFPVKYAVPDDQAESFREYLKQRPHMMPALRDPAQRLKAVRGLVAAGMSAIQQHEEELTAYALRELTARDRITVYGPKAAHKRAGLVAFNVEGMVPHAVAYELNKRGIEARNGNHCASLAHQHVGADGSVRLSFYIYNTKDDVSRAIDALDEILKE